MPALLCLSEKMSKATPADLISALAHSMNERDEETLLALFAADAVVRDGGLDYEGHAAIRCWIHNCFEKYDLALKVLSISNHDEIWILDAIVSGSFEGSPVRLDHFATLGDGKLKRLDI